MAIATADHNKINERTQYEQLVSMRPEKVLTVLRQSVADYQFCDDEMIHRQFYSHDLYRELLTMGVFTRILKQHNESMMAIMYQLQAFFNPAQLEQWERNRMMNKLAGKNE